MRFVMISLRKFLHELWSWIEKLWSLNTSKLQQQWMKARK
jgi:hypothetical protein